MVQLELAREQAAMTAAEPLRRPGRPEEVAAVVLFLASRLRVMSQAALSK